MAATGRLSISVNTGSAWYFIPKIRDFLKRYPGDGQTAPVDERMFELAVTPALLEDYRARFEALNAALGPLDYRVPEEMNVEPGSVVVAPLGPRQLLGIAWEADRLATNEVPDSRLRPLAGLFDVRPIATPLHGTTNDRGAYAG